MIVFLLIFSAFLYYLFERRYRNSDSYQEKESTSASLVDTFQVSGSYQKKWLLSNNEKKAYNTLKSFCDEQNWYLMTKVRLLDLVEPIKGQPHYKSHFYKIQAKHVDFVICDSRLVAQCIVELDDSSHKQAERIARDAFVDDVLHSVGYKVIRTHWVTENTTREIFSSVVG